MAQDISRECSMMFYETSHNCSLDVSNVDLFCCTLEFVLGCSFGCTTKSSLFLFIFVRLDFD